MVSWRAKDTYKIADSVRKLHVHLIHWASNKELGEIEDVSSPVVNTTSVAILEINYLSSRYRIMAENNWCQNNSPKNVKGEKERRGERKKF